ncbi:hypothetical protein NECID01_0373 [Nematocida sp. AWRm77]|nr:hypothetical protein NECID01_0373 [Nematocida sp. AWRm77]
MLCENMFLLLLLLQLVQGQYVDKRYMQDAVDVTCIENPQKEIYLGFSLKETEYSSIIKPEKTQQFGRNSYTVCDAVYTKKHKRKGQSIQPAHEDIVQSIQGWFIREEGTGMLSGVIIDKEKIIHIKPRQHYDTACQDTSLIAFLAENTHEYACTIPDPETEEESTLQECEEQSEEDYLDNALKYFQSRTPSEHKPQSFAETLKDQVPSALKKLLFWWEPVSTSAHACSLDIDAALAQTKEAEEGVEERKEREEAEKEARLKRLRDRHVQKHRAAEKKLADCTACSAFSVGKNQPQAPEQESKEDGTDALSAEYANSDSTHLEEECEGENEGGSGDGSGDGSGSEGESESRSVLDTLDVLSTLKTSLGAFLKDSLGTPLGRVGTKEETAKTPTQTSTKLAPSHTQDSSTEKKPGTPLKMARVKKGKKVYFTPQFYSKIDKVDKAISKPRKYGFPVERRAIPIAVAIDKMFIKKHGGSVKQAMFFVLETINIVSKIYEKSFNVNVYVSDMIIDTKAEWYHSSGDLLSKLKSFTAYRAEKKKKCLVYHLFSGCNAFRQIGLAWTGHIGQNDKRNVGTSLLFQNQFITVSHELAHNLGLVHDCDDDLCRTATPTNYPCHPCGRCSCKGKYLMNRKGTPNLLTFSPSSQREMSVILSQIEDILPKLNEVTLPYSVCGNGLVEKGEECDAGPFGDKCCTPTCRLKPGAACSDANNACCINCQIAPQGTVCRKRENECQEDSVCNGVSPVCPPPIYRPNKEKCSVGRCASGICTSKNIQCTLAGDRKGLVSSSASHNGCVMKCMNLEGEEVVMPKRYFRDGTPCGWNGACAAGRCEKDLRVKAIACLLMLVGVVLAAVLFLA